MACETGMRSAIDHHRRAALETAPQAHEVVRQAERRHSSPERVQLGLDGRVQRRRQVRAAAT